MADRFLRLRDVIAATGLKTTALYERMASGKFPKPVKLGKVSAWPESEVEAWQRAQIKARDAKLAKRTAA
jgi:prophage regulatory protein